MSYEKLVETLKHLPGQHNQSSHAGGKGRGKKAAGKKEPSGVRQSTREDFVNHMAESESHVGAANMFEKVAKADKYEVERHSPTKTNDPVERMDLEGHHAHEAEQRLYEGGYSRSRKYPNGGTQYVHKKYGHHAYVVETGGGNKYSPKKTLVMFSKGNFGIAD